MTTTTEIDRIPYSRGGYDSLRSLARRLLADLAASAGFHREAVARGDQLAEQVLVEQRRANDLAKAAREEVEGLRRELGEVKAETLFLRSQAEAAGRAREEAVRRVEEAQVAIDRVGRERDRLARELGEGETLARTRQRLHRRTEERDAAVREAAEAKRTADRRVAEAKNAVKDARTEAALQVRTVAAIVHRLGPIEVTVEDWNDAIPPGHKLVREPVEKDGKLVAFRVQICPSKDPRQQERAERLGCPRCGRRFDTGDRSCPHLSGPQVEGQCPDLREAAGDAPADETEVSAAASPPPFPGEGCRPEGNPPPSVSPDGIAAQTAAQGAESDDDCDGETTASPEAASPAAPQGREHACDDGPKTAAAFDPASCLMYWPPEAVCHVPPPEGPAGGRCTIQCDFFRPVGGDRP